MPTHHTHFVLTRELSRQTPRIPQTVALQTICVSRVTDEHLADLVCIGREQGLDQEWCTQQLAGGATCALALLPESSDQAPTRLRAVGMGLMTFGDFWVEEIGQCFQPGVDGCYLYGTYVSPSWRGRRIQQALDLARMKLAAVTGRRWAYAMVDAANTPSLRGHRPSGFRLAARIDTVQCRGVRLTIIRRLSPSRPAGRFAPACGTIQDHGVFPRSLRKFRDPPLYSAVWTD